MFSKSGAAVEDIPIGYSGKIVVEEIDLCVHGPGVDVFDEWEEIYIICNTTDKDIQAGQTVVFYQHGTEYTILEVK